MAIVFVFLGASFFPLLTLTVLLSTKKSNKTKYYYFILYSWGIRLILEALISFLPTPADGAIGALDWTSAERQRLAKASVNYHCATCGAKALDLLPALKVKNNADDTNEETEEATTKNNKKAFMFQKEIAKLQQLQALEHAQQETEEKSAATAKTSTEDEKVTDGKETDEKLATEDNTGEPALVDDSSSSSSSKVKFAETTTPTPTPKEETQEKSTTPPTNNSTTLDTSAELERACREDPETIRRQLLQGATPCSLRGEKRVEFEQRRIRQYYEHILNKSGRDIDWEAQARFQKEQEEHRAQEEEFEQQEAREQAAAKAPAQQADEQPPPQQHVPLVQERLEGPVPPPRPEPFPHMQQPPPPAAQDDLFSWILDPVLHGIIATLAVLCFLLLRKLQGMLAELNDLNEMLESA